MLSLLLLSFCLGLYHLDYQSVWLDEFTTLDVTKDLQTIMAYCRAFPEQHPLYYSFIYLLDFNSDIFKLRLFSLIFGTGSLVPLYIIARRVTSKKAAVLTCLLYFLSPFIMYYNQEGRMYSLLLFLSLVQVGFFLAWLDNPRKANRVGYFIFSVLALYTHFFGFFLIASETIFVFLFFRKYEHFRVKEFIVSILGIGIFYLPWMIFILKHLGENAQNWKGISNILFGFPYSIFRFALGYGVFPLNIEVKKNILRYLPGAFFWSFLIVAAYAPAALALIKQRKRLSPSQKLIPILAFTPIVLMVFMSGLKNMVSERYVIYSAPFFYMLVAIAYDSLLIKPKFLRISSVAMPMVLLSLGMAFYYFSPGFGKTNYKGVADFLKRESTQKSIILCSPGFVKGPLNYYLKDSRLVKSFKTWQPNPGKVEVWTLERMTNTRSLSGQDMMGYHKISEKIWPQENGLRLIQWSSQDGETSSHPDGMPSVTN